MSKVSEYKSKRKIRRIEIEPADNGFTSTIYHDHVDNLGRGANIGVEKDEPTKTLHTSVTSLVKHIRDHAQRHMGGM